MALPTAVRQHLQFWMGGLMLLLALGVTWGAQMRATQSLRSDVEAVQARVAQKALATVTQRFDAMATRLRAQARGLAQDTSVISALQTWQGGERRPATLVRQVGATRRDARTTVEVVGPSLETLAWNGPRLPFRADIRSAGVPAQPRLVVATDAEVRTALVAWHPITNAQGEQLGAVRVAEVIRYRPPVQNRYIQEFSLQQAWSDETEETVRVAWAPDAVAPADSPHVELRAGAEGPPLGIASVSPPAGERLIQQTRQTYVDWRVLWVTLLLAWIVGHGWVQYGRRTAGSGRAVGWFVGVAIAWWGLRYALLELDVPARWLSDGDLLAPLFDPTYLASPIGGGVMRSVGDLLITGGFAVVFAVGLLHLATQYRVQVGTLHEFVEQLQRRPPETPAPGRFVVVLLSTIVAIVGLMPVLASFVRRAVVDSTLDFFSRTGLLPEPLVLVVLCALFLLAVAAVLVGIGTAWISLRLLMRHRPSQWPRGLPVFSVAFAWIVGLMVAYIGFDLQAVVPFSVAFVFLTVVFLGGVFGLIGPREGVRHLTLRSLLPSVLALTVLLYPLLYQGMDTQRRVHMVDAASSFEAGRDPRVIFSVEQVLRSARDAFAALPDEREAALDSVATRLVRRSLLASLTTYEAHLTFFGADGTVRYRSAAAGPRVRARSGSEGDDRAAFETLRPVAKLQGDRPVVEQLLSSSVAQTATSAQLQYAGLVELPTSSSTAPQWALLRVEPRSLLPGTGTSIPRVLLPDGSYSDLYADLSLAEFHEGTLVRSFGRDFGRTWLPASIRQDLQDLQDLQDAPRDASGTRGVWRGEEIQGRQFLTYYTPTAGDARHVIAARIPAVLAFDHLYYLLRLAVAGLGVGALFYGLGAAERFRRGLLPATRVRFRDKVLNAFFVVGIVSMVAVGVVGVQVVTSENERVAERRLEDHLSRVEETLALKARPGEPLHRTAARADIDSLAARVGLDLRLYDGAALTATSRPRLVRDRLVDDRLDASVYETLYDDAHRFTTAAAAIGGFRYQVGYQALPDTTGRPRLVLAVPTLAQQERIEEEQARTLAYLFGALLMLVVVVMLTALVLANALARPIAQLREGLEAIGEGRFARVLPVDTRDEIGDLVRTFNDMREQLAESRRRLAQQERELAWREMARQVAHEIKNPLTPMKLSIQHLRRAFKRKAAEPAQGGDGSVADASGDEFAGMFDRITTTLIEQIEALARIANEFSSFARLPTKVLEPMDLNEVIEEAARLMQEESEAVAVEVDLCDAPLVVEADREDLRRIYINLIKNAVQAIPDDRDGHVVIRTTRQAPEGDAAPVACSSVEDNGTGIPEDQRDKIFQPNFSTKTSGTGLGLAIAKKSIEELDGRIGFDTTPGEGTTFWIRLPIAEDATVQA